MSDTAINSICACIITIFGLWIRYKLKDLGDKVDIVEKTKEATLEKVGAVEKKLDQNTQITQAGTATANANAEVAAKAVALAEETAKIITKKLNGGIDDAVLTAVTPLRVAINNRDVKDAQAVVVRDAKDAKAVVIRDQKDAHDLGLLMDKFEAVISRLDRIEKLLS